MDLTCKTTRVGLARGEVTRTQPTLRRRLFRDTAVLPRSDTQRSIEHEIVQNNEHETHRQNHGEQPQDSSAHGHEPTVVGYPKHSDLPHCATWRARSESA